MKEKMMEILNEVTQTPSDVIREYYSNNYCICLGIVFFFSRHIPTQIWVLQQSNQYVLRPHPGHTGNYTPVPGRRVGRNRMEESRRLVERYLNTYVDFWRNIKE